MAIKVTISSLAFKTSIGKQTEKIRPTMDANIIPALEAEKNRMLEEIANHPVSQDLNRKEVFGENSLYGLIGFDADSQNDPVNDLIDVVDETTIIPNTASSITAKSAEIVKAKYTVIATDQSDLDKDDRMSVHWGTSSNWVKLIERGVNGLEYFLRGTRFSTSRSGHGIQSKYQVREESYSARDYLTGIINKFKTTITNNINNQILTRFIGKTGRIYYNIRDTLGRFRRL